MNRLIACVILAVCPMGYAQSAKDKAADASVYLCVDGQGKKQYVTGKDVRENWESASCKKIDLPGITAIPEPKAKRSGSVAIGMTPQQAIAAWGKPMKINRTTTASTVREQWVYGGNNYLYFDNGVLTSFQN